MNNVFIVNASPLILLGKAELLRSVAPLSDLWIVSEGVVAEVEKKKSVGTYLAELKFTSKASLESIPQIHSLVAAWDLE